MMSDFDLSQALNSSPETSPEASPRSSCEMSESRRSDTKDVQDQIFRLDDGLDLRVSTNRRTLKSVADLVLMVNRMKPALPLCGLELSEGELCSAIMGCVVEETIVQTTVTPSGQRRTFQRVNSVKECSLCDLSHKDIVHQSGELKLQAVTLKGGNREHKLNFKMSRYVPACVYKDDGQTVLLSVAKNLHLSCTMTGDAVVLNLEECSEEDLKKISDDGNMARFLFFRKTSGISVNTFESVKHRGWFISTSCEPQNQTVEMCTVDTAYRLTGFKLNH